MVSDVERINVKGEDKKGEGRERNRGGTYSVEVTNERFAAVSAEIFTDDNTEQLECLSMGSHGIGCAQRQSNESV